jgi:outer membrane protein OmpU
MKKILFTSTALAAMAFGGVASAQGISLFGDARLGLGYNIFNNGDLRLETDDNGDLETPDDLRAVSRVRFGVNMSGVTDSGITFGATIRADNAGGGQGGTTGQTAGNVFVSGDWGTLTFGDTSGADEKWTGDVNEVGLTGLTFQNEVPFISNGGSFGRDDGSNTVANPAARPTVRYDFEVAGFGLSLSSNRDLNDVQVGAGYDGEFGESTFSIGVGYNDFTEFTNLGATTNSTVCIGAAGGVVTPPAGSTCGGIGGTPVSGVATPGTLNTVPGGSQWTAALGVDVGGMFNGKVVWTSIDFDGPAEVDMGFVGLGADFEEWRVDAYYSQIIDATGSDFLNNWDGLQAYGLGVTYDLGGGARVEGGVASVYNLSRSTTAGQEADDGYIVADFGIGLSF